MVFILRLDINCNFLPAHPSGHCHQRNEANRDWHPCACSRTSNYNIDKLVGVKKPRCLFLVPVVWLHWSHTITQQHLSVCDDGVTGPVQGRPPVFTRLSF